jgi:hypothetical protein
MKEKKFCFQANPCFIAGAKNLSSFLYLPIDSPPDGTVLAFTSYPPDRSPSTTDLLDHLDDAPGPPAIIAAGRFTFSTEVFPEKF